MEEARSQGATGVVCGHIHQCGAARHRRRALPLIAVDWGGELQRPSSSITTVGWSSCAGPRPSPRRAGGVACARAGPPGPARQAPRTRSSRGPRARSGRLMRLLVASDALASPDQRRRAIDRAQKNDRDSRPPSGPRSPHQPPSRRLPLLPDADLSGESGWRSPGRAAIARPMKEAVRPLHVTSPPRARSASACAGSAWRNGFP